jgi:hypothetical protein
MAYVSVAGVKAVEELLGRTRVSEPESAATALHEAECILERGKDLQTNPMSRCRELAELGALAERTSVEANG